MRGEIIAYVEDLWKNGLTEREKRKQQILFRKTLLGKMPPLLKAPGNMGRDNFRLWLLVLFLVPRSIEQKPGSPGNTSLMHGVFSLLSAAYSGYMHACLYVGCREETAVSKEPCSLLGLGKCPTCPMPTPRIGKTLVLQTVLDIFLWKGCVSVAMLFGKRKHAL